MKETWRQQMQQKMADHKRPAPKMVWDDIENAVMVNKTQAKSFSLWHKPLVAAVLVLIVAVAGYEAFYKEHKNLCLDTEIATHHQEFSQAHRNGKTAQRTASTKQPKPLVPNMTAVVPIRQIRTVPHRVDNEQVIYEDNKTEDAATAIVADTSKHVAERENYASEETLPATSAIHSKVVCSSDLASAKLRHHRLTAKVFLSNVVTNVNSFNSGFSNEPFSYSEPVHGTGQNDHSATPTEQKTTEETMEKADHHQPIRFGLSLRYYINNRWSLESGFTYTRLSSDILRVTNGTSDNIKQRLSYVGIPFHVNYQLWGNNRFDVYVSMGGMAEKMVKGRRTTDHDSESVTIRGLQFSVNGRVGAAYKVNELLSVYAEPGLNYFFDNGSPVPTFYQEQPFSLGFNVGLRFDFR